LKINNSQLAQEPVEMNKLTTEFYFVPAREGTNPKLDPKPVINNELVTLKILSTANGTIIIDGLQKGTIKANEILSIERLSIGEHFVQLITKDSITKTEVVKISSSNPVTIKF
jgi:hypothetical protein